MDWYEWFYSLITIKEPEPIKITAPDGDNDKSTQTNLD